MVAIIDSRASESSLRRIEFSAALTTFLFPLRALLAFILRCRRAGLLVELPAIELSIREHDLESLEPASLQPYSHEHDARPQTFACGLRAPSPGAEHRLRSFSGLAISIARAIEDDKSLSPRLRISHPPVVASAPPEFTLRP